MRAIHGQSVALLRCERGDDLVEYALLTAFVGLASMAAWATLRTTLATNYASYDAKTQALAKTPDPK
jgi:Flp pilus assembly pilin Flp